jgi:glycosyltransferase involved in cell wall biosynthesis
VESKSNYILITNIWNESKSIEEAFRRISKQTKKPRVWLWIDDGSTDDSAKVIQRLSRSLAGVDVWLEICPRKQVGNLDTIGRAYGRAIPRFREKIDRERIDYVAIMDVDSDPCPNYSARLTWLLDKNPDVGAAAGIALGEVGKRRVGLPMGTGKFVRWSIVRDIERFWDIAPDTLLNIKAAARGFKLKTWPVPMSMDKPTRALSSQGVFRQGRLSYYVGRPFWGVLLRALRRFLIRQHGTQMLRGYLYERERKVWRFSDPDVQRFYGRGSNPLSALLDLLRYAGVRD